MTRKEEFWTLYTRYMRLGAKLHKARPGDGAYYRDRLHIYTGLSGIAIDGSYLIGHTWKGWCACCGAETIKCYGIVKEAEISTPAVLLGLEMPNRRRDEPAFMIHQRCDICRRPEPKGHRVTPGGMIPTFVHNVQRRPKLPHGYAPKARRAIKAAGLPLAVLEREGHHYHFYDRDSRPWLLSDQERATHEACQKLLLRTAELC